MAEGPGHAGSQLIADIRPGRAESSDAYMLEGWGPPEGGHRWALGQESRMRLPVPDPGPDVVVVVHMAPWHDEAALPAQTVMLAVNGRLLATVQFSDHRVFGWRLPPSLAGAGETFLSFTHVSSGVPRPASGMTPEGLPLGIMVLSVRLFRLPAGAAVSQTHGRLPGSMDDGVLPKTVQERTGLSPQDLAYRFEGIGHDCEFGLLQRFFGAEPISLLRFTAMTTPHLVDGLVARFAGVGAPDNLQVYVYPSSPPTWRVTETRYFLWYGTGKSPDEVTREAVLRDHGRRLLFLRRKFLEDLQAGTKIFVVTRGESLMEPEALAVFCALNLDGRNTLLWTVHGDAGRTGEVDLVMEGFLRGHLGTLTESMDGTPDAWLSVLANAYLLAPRVASAGGFGAVSGAELDLAEAVAD